MTTVLYIIVALLFLFPQEAAARDPTRSLGRRLDTNVRDRDGEVCPFASPQGNDDGSFENAYAMSHFGVLAPDYGAWAECFEGDFVCGVQLLLTQVGDHNAQTMDVYVWESERAGNPAPGPDPGNVLCVLRGVPCGTIAAWPEISTLEIQVCCSTGGGLNFIGFWGDWPGEKPGWYVAGDEDGPPLGCPRVKIVPGISFPSGWNHPSVLPDFSLCRNLGIRGITGLGDCHAPPTPAATGTWGQVKALY